MEQNQDLADYRASLLKRLEERVRRSTGSPSHPTSADLIQVFVNGQRVGWLCANEPETAARFHCHGHVDHVELRSEEGLLLGGLLAPERGVRFARVSLGRDWVELSIVNSAEGASVNAVYHAVPSAWRRFIGRFVETVAGSVGAVSARSVQPALTASMRSAVVMQAVLAVVVLWLAVDRLGDWIRRDQTSAAVTRAEVSRLEQQIDALAKLQVEAVGTIQSQQQGMAQLRSAIVELSSTQEAVASGVMTVKKEIESRRKKSGREVERMARLLMNQTQMDQQQLEAQIRSLTVANERLSEEMTKLIEQNNDLMKRLKATEVDVSKHAVPQQEPVMMAGQADDQPALDGERTVSQPFLFWVHFHEGTSEEHIEQWVQEVQGRRGGVEEGWQEVEVMQLDLPTDRFLERVKGANIVKAVRAAR